jgi:hypothetical protein
MSQSPSPLPEPDPADLAERLVALEARVRLLEDENALHRLMTSYGPAVDSGSADEAGDLWTTDGTYETDGGTGVMEGSAGVAAMVRGRGHQSLLPNCAHQVGPGVVRVDGDRAEATTYSRVYLREGDTYRVWRVAVNQWHFVRTDAGWRIERRINRSLGHPESAGLLRHALELS